MRLTGHEREIANPSNAASCVPTGASFLDYASVGPLGVFLGTSRRPPQHPLDHRRGPEPRPRLLRRHLRRHPAPRPLRPGSHPLHPRLRHRAGLLARALLPDHRRVRHLARHPAPAVRLPHSRRRSEASPPTSAKPATTRTNNVKTDYNIANEAAFISDCLGPEQLARPTGETAPKVSALLQRLQPDDHPPVAHQRLPLRASSSKKSRTASNPARHHDPAQAPLPPYYPDIPSVRETLARYHDCITRHGRRSRRDPRPTRSRRPGRRHHRLLLRRPRPRPAARQARAAR